MLDNLPPFWRDALILLGGAVLAWAGQDLMPILGPWLDAHPPLGPLAGALLAHIMLVLLPFLTRQYGAGSGRHVADRGAAGVRVGLALALVAMVMLAMPAAAAPRRHPAVRPGPLFVGITSARSCAGLLELRYSTERLGRGAWEVVPDSWGADVQLHHIGAAAGPGGRWEPAPATTRRGEGYVGVPIAGLPTWDLVRVVLEDDGTAVASSGRLVEGCPE